MVKLSRKDLISAYRIHLKPEGPMIFKLATAGIVVLVAANVLLDVSIPDLLLWVFSIGAGYAFCYYVYFPYNWKKIFDEQKDLQMPFEFHWDSKYCYWKSDYGDSKIPWTDITRLKEDPEFVLLYRSRAIFQLIPKTAFKDESDYSEFKIAYENRGV